METYHYKESASGSHPILDMEHSAAQRGIDPAHSHTRTRHNQE